SSVPTVNLVDSSEGTLVTTSPRLPTQGYKTEPQRSALSKGQHARQRAGKQNRARERVMCPRDRGHSSPSSSNDRGSTPSLAPGLCAVMPNSMPTHPEVGWLVAMLP